jgi:hypothetical protein
MFRDHVLLYDIHTTSSELTTLNCGNQVKETCPMSGPHISGGRFPEIDFVNPTRKSVSYDCIYVIQYDDVRDSRGTLLWAGTSFTCGTLARRRAQQGIFGRQTARGGP